MTKPCEWCPDDTCVYYWRVNVLGKVHIICNCCYEHLKKVGYKKGFATREEMENLKNESLR